MRILYISFTFEKQREVYLLLLEKCFATCYLSVSCRSIVCKALKRIVKAQLMERYATRPPSGFSIYMF